MGKKARRKREVPDVPTRRDYTYNRRKQRANKQSKQAHHDQGRKVRGAEHPQASRPPATSANSKQDCHPGGTGHVEDKSTITRKTVEVQKLEAWQSMYGHWVSIATAPLPPNRKGDDILAITRATLVDALNTLHTAVTTPTPASTNNLKMHQVGSTLPAAEDTIEQGCTTPLPPPSVEDFPAQRDDRPGPANGLHPRNLDPELSSVTPEHRSRKEDSVMEGSQSDCYGFPTHSHSPRHFAPMGYPGNPSTNPLDGLHPPTQSPQVTQTPTHVTKAVEEG